MDVVILLVFISLMLVAGGLVFFIFRLRDGDFDHGERLALAPLSDDGGTTTSGRSAVAPVGRRVESPSIENVEGG